MKLDEYICYIKDDKVNSLGMELNSTVINEKFKVGGGKKTFLRKNLGIPLSLFLINNKKNVLDDFINETNSKKPKLKKKKTECVPGDLFKKLINLRANPTIKKKKTKKQRERLKKNKKKQKKTKKNKTSFF